MIRIALAVGIAALTAIASPTASAQTAGGSPTFTPAERTAIRNWIKRQRPAAVKERLSIGAPLPIEVESYPVPKGWGQSVARYRYVHSGKQVYFVDPISGRIVLKVD